MTQVTVTDTRGRRLRVAENRMNLVLAGARGPIGLDIVGDPAARAGKLVQFVAGGSGRRVAPVAGGGADNTLRADLAANTGSALVTSKADETGSSALGQDLINEEMLTTRRMGAIGDGSTDDTLAAQKAVTAANSYATAKVLFVVGRVRVTSSLFIDRLVDTKGSYLRIVGIGEGAGFIVDGDFPLFDSHLRHTDASAGTPSGAPVSEKVRFEGVTFYAADPSSGASVISKRFLRTSFINCDFEGIRLGDFNRHGETAGYCQQISIQGGHARRWQGWFVDAWQMYHLNIGSDFQMEAGEKGFQAEAGIFESGAGDFLFEGCAGPAFFIAGGFNFDVGPRVYLEGNDGPDIVCADVANGGATRGVVLTGIHIKLADANAADPDFYPVILGNSRGVATGNGCINGNLYDDAATAHGNWLSIGDCPRQADPANGVTAGKLNKSGLPIEVGPQNLVSIEVDVVATGSNAAGAHQIKNEMVRVTSGSGGVKLPSGDYGSFAGMVRIVNFSPSPIRVYADTGDTINGALSILMGSGSDREFWCSPPGQWNMNAYLPYQAALSTGADLPTLIAAFNQLNQHMRDIGEQLPS